jgi:hypothetical protein
VSSGLDTVFPAGDVPEYTPDVRAHVSIGRSIGSAVASALLAGDRRLTDVGGLNVTRTTRRLVSTAIGVAALVTMWPADALAQRRVYRRVPVRSTVVIRAGYYSPFYYSRYYSPFYYDPFFYGWGWGAPYYGQYPPYGVYPRMYEAGSDLRIQVTPREAEVYLDGYLVGNVDNFDGVLQRLRVPYGEHEITIYKEGFRPVRQKMLFRPGESYRIRETLQPLAGGEANDPRPTPTEAPEGRASAPAPYGGRGRTPAPPPRDRPSMERPPMERGDRSAFGTLSIRVQPGDAEVLVDGERWERPEGDGRLSIELSEGSHRIEIRKAGFKAYSSTVRVRRGESVPLNVSLPPSD